MIDRREFLRRLGGGLGAAAFDADTAALRARHTREQAEAWRDYLKGSAE